MRWKVKLYDYLAKRSTDECRLTNLTISRAPYCQSLVRQHHFSKTTDSGSAPNSVNIPVMSLIILSGPQT